ncbi:MAG: hypothetical protein CR982_02675 [Candidatus Cloacimonadota bacterium]|nr:MAG: hypothetical protein CR982_02675 [Candidatus Cloacimonadota bacterium]PIE79334.1 MAG: hypothetical protein CSA15_03530 [Candidatus Delongbacteria bacterium]
MDGILRIDDRLIHGQVVVGWGNFIHPDEIILIDDDIAEDEMEREIYLLGVPVEYEGKIFNTEDGADYLNECEKKFIAVVKSPKDVVKLMDNGLRLNSLNIGGMHDKVGKNEFNHYVYLSDEDRYYLDMLKSSLVEIYVQDLPGSKKVNY